MRTNRNTYLFCALVLSLAALFPLIGYIYYINNNKTAEPTTGDVVYVCTSNMATRYHITPDCEGLQSCSSRIAEISQIEAEQQGKTPCHLCIERQ